MARERSVRIIASANDRAGVILSDAKLVGTKALQKARKRAARETQALRDEVRRMQAETAIELRRVQLAAAFVRGRTFRLQERANSLSRDIETKAQIWAAEEAAVAARAEAARVQQAAKAEADRIRTEAVAAAEAEQARADAARRARDEAEAARLAADQAAAEAIGKADAKRAAAARASARAHVVTAGLTALTEEMAAGTLRVREGGRVTARAPELLRPAYPEIAPAVQAAATIAEQTRAARREADAVARATEGARKAAEAKIAEDKAAAARAIVQERQEAHVELKTQREAVTRELAAKRLELERQETEVKKQGALMATLLAHLEPLIKKVIRWLSHPDLPPSMKDEGIEIAAEAFSVLGALRPDDPEP